MVCMQACLCPPTHPPASLTHTTITATIADTITITIIITITVHLNTTITIIIDVIAAVAIVTTMVIIATITINVIITTTHPASQCLGKIICWSSRFTLSSSFEELPTWIVVDGSTSGGL